LDLHTRKQSTALDELKANRIKKNKNKKQYNPEGYKIKQKNEENTYKRESEHAIIHKKDQLTVSF
jgi:hypothetical protein